MKSKAQKENNRLYMTGYVANNREAVNARERYQRVKAEEALKRKAYYIENREKILPVVAAYAAAKKAAAPPKLPRPPKVKKLPKPKKPRRARQPKDPKAIYARSKQRRLVDGNYAASIAMRKSLSSGLRRVGVVKGHKTVKYLGCSFVEAKNHIESLFQPGMSWANWGLRGWHIDHKRPISSFDYTDPNWVFKASHYTNLQPLWALENLTKSAKWDGESC